MGGNRPLPGPRGHAEGFRHLIAFNPRRSEARVVPFFYGLGSRRRRHEVTCPRAHGCQVAKRRLKAGASASGVRTQGTEGVWDEPGPGLERHVSGEDKREDGRLKAQPEQRWGAGNVVPDACGYFKGRLRGRPEGRFRRIVKGLEGLGQALVSLQDATDVPKRRGPVTKRCDDRQGTSEPRPWGKESVQRYRLEVSGKGRSCLPRVGSGAPW